MYFLSALVFFSSQSSVIYAQENKLEPVGNVTFSFLFWDIYDVSLFTKNGLYSADQVPLTLQFTYLREISSNELVDETEKQWLRFKMDELKIKLWLEQLQNIWPDVDESDTITFHIDNNHNTSFYFNQRFIGKIDGAAFAKAFSKLWLGLDGPYPKMTKQLTGQLD
jgi:hypothetical protein